MIPDLRTPVLCVCDPLQLETLYKRKPWLRLQDDYNRQKVRRTGRPKKGR